MSISAEFQERLRDLVEETGLNKTKIAKEMGVSQAQVSRMESRILKRLREYAEIGL